MGGHSQAAWHLPAGKNLSYYQNQALFKAFVVCDISIWLDPWTGFYIPLSSLKTYPFYLLNIILTSKYLSPCPPLPPRSSPDPLPLPPCRGFLTGLLPSLPHCGVFSKQQPERGSEHVSKIQTLHWLPHHSKSIHTLCRNPADPSPIAPVARSAPATLAVWLSFNAPECPCLRAFAFALLFASRALCVALSPPQTSAQMSRPPSLPCKSSRSLYAYPT